MPTILPPSQSNLGINSTVNNSRSSQVNNKAELLGAFETFLNYDIDEQGSPDDQMAVRHNVLKMALCGQRHSNIPNILSTCELFENRNTGWGKKTVTESGSLALIAFALKVFGERILTAPLYTSIDQHKLDMAMHMLFGHDMPKIKSDLFRNIRLVAPTVGSNQYTLHSKHYEVDVIADFHPAHFNDLINATNVNQTYFHKMDNEEVVNFFGDSEAEPSILKECAGKNFQTPENRERDASSRRETIKKDKTLYSNKVRTPFSTGHLITTAVALITPLESTRSSFNKARNVVPIAPEAAEQVEAQVPSLGRSESVLVRSVTKISELTDSRSMLVDTTLPATENRKEIPTNVYQANLSLQIDRDTAITSHVTLVGSQMNGTAEENRVKATKVIESLKFGDNSKQKKIILDIRYYTSIKKTGFGGDERGIWNKHTAAMTSAVEIINAAKLLEDGQRKSENDPDIRYLPVHVEAHSDADVFVPNMMIGAAGAATVFLAGAGGKHAYDRIYNQPSFDIGAAEHAVGNALYEQFKLMSPENQEKYQQVYLKWLELHDGRMERHNAGPYAALTHILVSAINSDPGTDTYIELLMGCKSAKDRTTAALEVMTLLEPLILMELTNPEGADISRFFTTAGTLNVDGLTPDELMFLKERYDIRLLHVGNHENEDADTNVSVGLLKDFGQHAEFIKNSKPFTVWVFN